MQYKFKLSILLIGWVMLGVVVALAIPFVRYHKYVQPPTVLSIEPEKVYEYILANPGMYQFLDVRSKNEYETLHASSSISFPIADMYERSKLNNIDDNKKIFLICTSGRLAGVAYRYLEHFGYRNIVHIDGGVQGWVAAGLPVVGKNLFE